MNFILLILSVMELSSIEVLYNDCYGGFDLSAKFKETFLNRYPDKKLSLYPTRTDKDMISLVKELGLNESSGQYSNIKIGKINFPSNIPEKSILTGVTFSEYDGVESIGINKNNVLFNLIDTDYFSLIEDIKMFIKNDFNQITIERN